MRKLPALCLALSLTCALLAVACDGSNSSSGAGPSMLVLAPDTLPDGEAGTPYAQTLVVAGGSGSFVWSVAAGGLPPGLTLDTASTASTSTITGTPTTVGSFSFTVLVTDGTLADAASYNVNIQAATGGTGLVITTTVLPAATVNGTYNFALQATGGTGPLTWSITSGVFSPGLSLSGTGVISGTPTVTGAWGFTALVDDGSATAQRAFTLNVNGVAGNATLEQQLRQMIQQQGIVGLNTNNLPNLNAAQVELGRLLFFDKILSGTQDVACATCHHPSLNTGDRLNLSIGVGATGGIGPGRDHPSKVFIPRNAQPIYNIGLFPELFWDKRVGRPPQNPPPPPGSPPPPTQTPEGQTNLAPDEAQALFPLTSLTEMRGTGHSLDGLGNAAYRDALVARLATHSEYVTRFNAAFGAGQMNVNNMVRAIAQYERSQTFINAPWDRYLRGDANALTDAQKRGAQLFFGPARCNTCHSGPLLTNFSTHNLGIPQFGPGQGNGTGTEDFGFENTTGNPAHRYQFRVPSLRNVAFTAPYMHNGAFMSLSEVLLHYRDKAASTNAFTGTSMTQGADLAPTLLPTANVLANPSNLFTQVPGNLTAQQLADLEAFLHALTDPAAINRTQEIPASVPSGLPVDR
ncbi:MAG: putative Ig domain-containing protein [Planctomycetes bacterium]|jgi:cytochrome c peroxidase|nr:putative Ig domain-containing protein [Planctomycetota bacterium]